MAPRSRDREASRAYSAFRALGRYETLERYESAVSAFSNFTAHAVEVDELAWEEIAVLRCEQARKINLIKAEVQAMIASSKIQKNVNMAVKDG